MTLGIRLCFHAVLILSGFLGSNRTGTMLASASKFCPAGCVCQGTEFHPRVDCSAKNLTRIPTDLGSFTTHLDLSMNNISRLEDFAFSDLKFLEEVRLAGNSLVNLPPNVFAGVISLKILHLQENLFTEVPSKALQKLEFLQQLHMDANMISSVPEDSFSEMRSLRQLWLDGNQLKEIPVAAINIAPSLEALTLAVNQITYVQDLAFTNLTTLAVLLLYDNKISQIGDHAFDGLNHLKILEIDKNELSTIPVGLSSLPEIEELSISDNKIEFLPDDSFSGNKKLKIIGLKNNPIMSVGLETFTNLPRLENLVISEARDQEDFPDLTGTPGLSMLGFDRSSISFIPKDLCVTLPRLKSFDIHSNRITSIPDMGACKELRILNLGNNELSSLEGNIFKGLDQLRDLTLSHNYIQHLPHDAFLGLGQLQYLDLQHNKIENIHPDAFIPISKLEDLNLGENFYPVLPTNGLENLKNLKTFNNKHLKDFPSASAFPKIHILTLSYAYHCCEFIKSAEDSPGKQIDLKEDIIWLSKDDYDMSLWRNLTNIWGPLANLTSSYDQFAGDIWEGLADDYDFSYPDKFPSSADHYYSDYTPRYDSEDFIIAKPPIICKPMPGPFMPCDDLMGWWSLRCGVWVVFMLAVIGNGAVIFVTVSSRSKLDVPRFLICNLACSDFFMGIYLGFLAIVDASTLGEFKKYAIKWQTSPGCLVAGFLGVLSSELSVFTLTVITLERFYAITHAMHLNKRLSLKHAGYIMVCGWFFAICLATMPILGVSDYRKFAVCLPFEIGDSISLSYVCFIMFLNCCAFVIIVSCYTKMYCSIRGSQAWNSNDSRVAKRMALLVFTDFACWAPISFLSLTAAFGHELISLDYAKFFTIFILPLNSCANPFLYAIFTKQFKKDCSVICKRLEESSISKNLARLGNRNVSLSWGSSRRPSALNSFGNAEKQAGHSSISNGSAGNLLEAITSWGTKSSTVRSIAMKRYDPKSDTQNTHGIDTASGSNVACPCRTFISGSSSALVKFSRGDTQIVPDVICNTCPFHGKGGGEVVDLKKVDATSSLVTICKPIPNIDIHPMSMLYENEQEEGGGGWLKQESDSGGNSSLLQNDHQVLTKKGSESQPVSPISNGKKSSKGTKSKSSSPSFTKSMHLSCCIDSTAGNSNTPGLEYQLMKTGDGNDSSQNTSDNSDGPRMELHISPSGLLLPQTDNNNHEYVNVTDAMISELQKIRDTSPTRGMHYSTAGQISVPTSVVLPQVSVDSIPSHTASIPSHTASIEDMKRTTDTKDYLKECGLSLAKSVLKKIDQHKNYFSHEHLTQKSIDDSSSVIPLTDFNILHSSMPQLDRSGASPRLFHKIIRCKQSEQNKSCKSVCEKDNKAGSSKDIYHKSPLLRCAKHQKTKPGKVHDTYGSLANHIGSDYSFNIAVLEKASSSDEEELVGEIEPTHVYKEDSTDTDTLLSGSETFEKQDKTDL